MHIVVTGGRDFNDKAFVYATLDRLNKECGPFTLVGHGDATGADYIAFSWARDRGIDWKLFVAHWTKQGNAAGPLRNGKMLRIIKPNLVIAFPGHTGTTDCCMQAQAMGIRVIQISQDTASPKGGLVDLASKRKERVRTEEDQILESGSKFFSATKRYKATGRKLGES